MKMNGVAHTDLGHSLLIEECALPTAISQINIAKYKELSEVVEWLAQHDHEIQCISCSARAFIDKHSLDCAPLRRATAIGTTQHPSLTDYPDAEDVMEWLKNLA